MAITDYGALLKVDGKFINRDVVFDMQGTETGYICNTATYNGESFNIQGNYFVYAGDEDLLLAFSKGNFIMISHNKIVDMFLGYEFTFASETINTHGINLTIEHLDKHPYKEQQEILTWEEYMQFWYNVPDTFDFVSYRKSSYYKEYIKYVKKIARYNKKGVPYRTFRFKATWDYKNKHYEVIYGYGLDAEEEVWDDTKQEEVYDFTEKEIEIVDGWFKNV